MIGVVGTGTMGAICASVISQVENEIGLYNPTPQKALALAKKINGTSYELDQLLKEADTLLLAMKPQQLDNFCQRVNQLGGLKGKTILSLLAGVTLDRLTRDLGSDNSYVRLMPNTALSVGQGVMLFSLPKDQAQDLSPLVFHLFQAAGLVIELEESKMDAATALAGCGPAFLFQIMEAMTQSGLAMGLTHDEARALSQQTFLGVGSLAKEDPRHLAQLRDQICSPGGSTIAGLLAMQEAGGGLSVQAGIKAAYARNQVLGINENLLKG